MDIYFICYTAESIIFKLSTVENNARTLNAILSILLSLEINFIYNILKTKL